MQQPCTKGIFVGRKNELEQFSQTLGQPGLINRLVLDNPGRNIKSRVFLPYGIGGIGKSELTRQCLARAKEIGWRTLLLDWDLIGRRPVEPIDVTNTIADALKGVAGEGGIKPYLDERKEIAAVEEQAKRYRAEKPELLEKAVSAVRAVQGIDPEPVSKIGLAVAGALLDEGPQVLAKLADEMLAHRRIRAEDVDRLTKPDAALARCLAACIVGTARAHSLVIALDTCEMLPPTLEEYVRDLIITPAIQQTNGLLVIISGRYNQYQRREVEGSNGSQMPVKGYADRLKDPPPLPWNLSQFADPEIEDYLRESGFNPTADLVSYIQETARGVPFAVQLLVEALCALGSEKVRNEFPPHPNDLDLPDILRLVVQRFLHYCLQSPTDLSRIYALALLRERDDSALRSRKRINPYFWHQMGTDMVE